MNDLEREIERRLKQLSADVTARINEEFEALRTLAHKAAVRAAVDSLQQTMDKADALAAPSAPANRAKSTATTAPKKKSTKSAKGTRKVAPLKRTPAEVQRQAEKLLSHVYDNPGQNAEEIGPLMGMSSEQMRLPMRQLIDKGLVRREGERRSARYFPAKVQLGLADSAGADAEQQGRVVRRVGANGA